MPERRQLFRYGFTTPPWRATDDYRVIAPSPFCPALSPLLQTAEGLLICDARASISGNESPEAIREVMANLRLISEAPQLVILADRACQILEDGNALSYIGRRSLARDLRGQLRKLAENPGAIWS